MVKPYLFILSLAVVSYAHAGDTEATSNNPHKSTAMCQSCHVISAHDLASADVAALKKRELRGGINEVCTQCHKVSLGHGVGKKPEMNTQQLPIGPDGAITCAITCHDMHLVKPETAVQRRYYLRVPHKKLCSSCHAQ